jgi:hypothetical protein
VVVRRIGSEFGRNSDEADWHGQNTPGADLCAIAIACIAHGRSGLFWAPNSKGVKNQDVWFTISEAIPSASHSPHWVQLEDSEVVARR